MVLFFIVATLSCTRHEEPTERDLLNLIHERPIATDRLVAGVLSEGHGVESLKNQLKKNPAAAKMLVEFMLADRQLGPMVRERCEAHLVSKPQERK